LEDRPLAAAITTQVLRIDRSCDAVRYGVEFCSLQRSGDALLFGSTQWGAISALIVLAVLLTSKSVRPKRRGKVGEHPNIEKGNG
jgi:hypothetical protein